MSTADRSTHPPEVVAGQVVGGKWRVGPLIGRGGMGAVYEGTNTSIGKKVALKFIDAEFARQPEIASRFQREAEAASLVESAHIIHIFDSGTTDDGLPYIVMELLRGEDLRRRLTRMGRLPRGEAGHIVAQTLRGLHRAHEAGIVHRDLKPDNIFLVDRDDDSLFAKIVDFGISKMMRRAGEGAAGTLTRQGVVLGTPHYMSPEQAQALADLDLRTDLWSVGAILFECLSGRPPHLGDAYEQIIISICTTDAPDIRSLEPSVPAPLAAFLARALSRDRTLRFQTAKEMLDALTPAQLPHAAPSGAADPSRDRPPDAASGRTRVSWAQARVPSVAVAAVGAGTDADDERMARARGMRRRGLAVVGGVLMIGAFVLTFGLLRDRKDAERVPTPTPGDMAGRVSASPAPVASSPAATAASADPRAAKDVAPSPTARTGSAAPAIPSQPRKRANAMSNVPAPTVAVATPPPAPVATASAKVGGVAGGLQIKTSYP